LKLILCLKNNNNYRFEKSTLFFGDYPIIYRRAKREEDKNKIKLTEKNGIFKL
jgi:hypothetical protein